MRERERDLSMREGAKHMSRERAEDESKQESQRAI